MAPQKVIKQYARATYTVSNKFGSVSATATASSNKDSPPDKQANVLAQAESVKLAMIEVNKRNNNQSKGVSKAIADSSDTGSGVVVTSTSPYGYWLGPMMTNLNKTPFQLCARDTGLTWLYYSADTINWTNSKIDDSDVKSLGAIAISGKNAIGIGYYMDTAQTQYLIYSIDGGQTWKDTKLVVYLATTVGTLSDKTGYLCTYTSIAPNIVNDYYSTSNGGSSWSLMGSYTNTSDDSSLSTYSIASSGTNILWSLNNGDIYYSTSTYPTSPTDPDGVSTYIGNIAGGRYTLLAISGNYGLVAYTYVYIINLKDDAPKLVKCDSAGSQAWTSVYISDTPDASGNISAIVASQDKTIYSTDITASPIVWNDVLNTSGILQAAISGSNAIMVKNAVDYLYYSADGGATWTSTSS
jgi:hypothetical protein